MRTGIIDLGAEFQVEIINKLIESKKIDLKYTLYRDEFNFHGDYSKFEKLNQKQKEQTDFFTSSDLIFSEDIIELSKIPFTISEELILETKYIESLFYRITDRAASSPISVHERRLYYLLMLNYFNTVIVENKLELIITFDTPHAFSTMVFHQLAKHYNIKVVLLEYLFFEDLSLIMDEYDFPKVPSDYLNEVNDDDLQKMLPEFIQKKISEKNVYVSSFKAKEKKSLRSKNSILKLRLRLIEKKIINLVLGVMPFLREKELLHFTSLNNIKSPFLYRLKLNQLINKLFKLNKYYLKIAVEPDFTSNYIFMGFHMQPEKTSQPLGNESDNQFFPIFLLSKNLPKGWKIYIKEHPNQFNLRKVSNRNYRSKNFYDAILKLGNVEFVSFDTSADELIQNAKAVATLCGTIGWEALNIGKPVIAFGSPYYLGCQSVYQLKNKEQSKTFFDKLNSITKEEVLRDFYKYLVYYSEKEYFSKGSNFEVKIKVSKYDREWHAESMANSIAKRIDGFNSN